MCEPKFFFYVFQASKVPRQPLKGQHLEKCEKNSKSLHLTVQCTHSQNSSSDGEACDKSWHIAIVGSIWRRIELYRNDGTSEEYIRIGLWPSIHLNFSQCRGWSAGQNRLYFEAMTTFGLVVLLLEEPEVPRAARGRVRAGCSQVHGLVQGNRLCRLPVITSGFQISFSVRILATFRYNYYNVSSQKKIFPWFCWVSRDPVLLMDEFPIVGRYTDCLFDPKVHSSQCSVVRFSIQG